MGFVMYGMSELAAKRVEASLRRHGYEPLVAPRGMLQDDYWTVQVEPETDGQAAQVERIMAREAKQAKRLA